MTSFFRKSLFGIAIVAFIVTSVTETAARKRNIWGDTDARKADYVFMEAMRRHALENEDAYYDLLGRAYEASFQ